LPGIGVIVGNISTAPTQDESITPVSKISVIESCDLMLINLIEFIFFWKVGLKAWDLLENIGNAK
jgi:hypothetical protein